MTSPAYYSADMVRALPDDGNRYETVHGELLMTPSQPRFHEELVGRVSHGLREYLAEYSIGQLFTPPADISWGPYHLVQPDVFVVDLDEARSLEWGHMQTLLLVVEVLSVSTLRHDRFTKRRLYQEVNVPDYWVVDPTQRTVEMWTPKATTPHIERSQLVWTPLDAAPSFTLPLGQLFEPLPSV